MPISSLRPRAKGYTTKVYTSIKNKIQSLYNLCDRYAFQSHSNSPVGCQERIRTRVVKPRRRSGGM